MMMEDVRMSPEEVLKASKNDCVGPYVESIVKNQSNEKYFVEYLSIGKDKSVVPLRLTRTELFHRAMKAAEILQSNLNVKECALHYFTDNRLEDLVFRFGAVLAGTTPVTVNWQADTAERVAYKATITNTRLALIDDGADRSVLPASVEIILNAATALIDTTTTPLQKARLVALNADDSKIIIFTSGTTGLPKGVKLSYRAYETNRNTFEDFLCAKEKPIEIIAANPFHHTNSTATTDWALRKPNATLRLFQRYTTTYWRVLAFAVAGLPFSPESSTPAPQMIDLFLSQISGYLIVCPLVSRHIDFLEDLCQRKPDAVPTDILKAYTKHFAYLLGSAPVGPKTVSRLRLYLNALPVVRFGSTETCLQVCGTPLKNDEGQRLLAFQQGWAHEYPQGIPCIGYYIGRDHRPYTYVKIVKSVDPQAPDFLKECERGEPGQIITRGNNLFSGYIGIDKNVIHQDWYTNLGDVGFALGPSCEEIYWYSRDSAMLIRGGANYAYEQINDELINFVISTFKLKPEQFRLAVVGLKINSEHEDSCCVTIELLDEMALKLKSELEDNFIRLCKDPNSSISKGSKPDLFRIASIPTNFKGVVLNSELINSWKDYLATTKEQQEQS
eukprot:CAMPEP_0197309530 /NCGR_PEP_ID=MMETSP0891-20130614/8108_1 /TAXON_ID=44058 ORGANISM="Aureoumbra lagunensis, Strain CCMP1510" /NCGR_SAMPLE_ID=MMETSP0891 /ASSEMBLY_ACC=CAM_ASM_000534 /LENGTH=614 /DNA_ID=CAMNT_0042794647 /DNA_START=17 /DNA_END=1861 /DNA_ORIENTATION=+